ncbi:hypothetical protein DL96DRAFT_1811027 [Flagelloscypha sp. PMI_526]|nr:hypothetical protein DL96DRAFT_1811027 [Flagelloscypha sp. PMI_526]
MSSIFEPSLGYPELPVELWKEILTYLLHGPRHEYFINSRPLCSVSRIFRAISLPFLFHEISLTQAEADVDQPEEAEGDTSSSKHIIYTDPLVIQSFRLLKLLRSFPDIAKFIKTVDILLRTSILDDSDYREGEDPATILVMLLPLLGNIERLSIGRDPNFIDQGQVEWNDIPYSTQDALTSVFQLPSLHTLQFTSSTTFPTPAASCISFPLLPNSGLRSLALTNWQFCDIDTNPVRAALHKVTLERLEINFVDATIDGPRIVECLLSEASPFDVTNLKEFVVLGLTPSDIWICTLLDAQATGNTLTTFRFHGIFDYGFSRALPYTTNLRRFTSIHTVSFATYLHAQYKSPMVSAVIRGIPLEVSRTIRNVTIFTNVLAADNELQHLKDVDLDLEKHTMPSLSELRIVIVPVVSTIRRHSEANFETLPFGEAKECVEQKFLAAKEAGILIIEEVDRDPFPCDYW